MAKRLFFLFAATAVLMAHPMGNFSVSHYARFQVQPKGVAVTYVLDLAELPTFDLLREWGLEKKSPRADLNLKASVQAAEWAKHLQFLSNGRAVRPAFLGSELVLADGAGDLPIARITSHLMLNIEPGTLEYEDRNYPDRAGWKEIVIDGGPGVTLAQASQGSQDRSKALSEYPADPTVAPPQDLRASVQWSGPVAVPTVEKPVEKTKPQVAPVIAPIPQPKAPPMPAPATMTPQAAPAGSVVKGDFLSRLLHQRDLTLGMILIALVVAFGLGAAHALTPGHGKTIVAAYLVGSRGTLKHAAFLGAMVTFTHTVSVFLLGLATLFLFQYVMPEKISQALGVISGLSIVAIGGWMLYTRWRAIAQKHVHAHHHHTHDHDHQGHVHDHQHEPEHVHAHAHDHSHAHAHAHDHPHAHAHAHDHPHAHAHAHDHPHAHDSHGHDHHHDHGHAHDQHHDDHGQVHSHGPLVHSHGPGGHVHSHDVPDQITWGSLTALAVSGGLVPCESALVLLLSAIALGRVGLGLMLLIAFSLGLAVVLMAIGVMVIYAKNLFPKSEKTKPHPLFRWVPVLSAGIVTVVGLLMTGVSLGWLRTGWVL